MNEKSITTIDLLRHGELKTKGLFCAKPDEPLSEKGIQNLLKATKNKKWDVVVSSPFERCRQFAIKFKTENDAKLLTYDKAFQEMDFGRWVGISSQQLWAQEPEKLSQLWQAPQDFVAPSGESMQDFNNRIEQATNALVNTHKNQSILLVTHAGVIRSILSLALQLSPVSALKFNIDYAQMIRLHYYPDGQFSLQSSLPLQELN